MNSEILYDGKHLLLRRLNGWEYVERKGVTGVVGIIGVTPAAELLLVEQYRLPVAKNVIELPAGLAGDVAGMESEDLAVAAHRELLEETGFSAKRLVRLVQGTSSAGLTSETTVLFLAEEIEATGPGGGDGTEKIALHKVPLAKVENWLSERAEQGALIDFKVYAALHFLDRSK